eukprot:GHRQ01027462.1.p1 GENE.GHRQ01027462.1~~GHRQ01027462.1.p1  ORF type:complete len:121 (+),score=44.85 GHRQ01027462.1:196-558(+)
MHINVPTWPASSDALHVLLTASAPAAAWRLSAHAPAGSSDNAGEGVTGLKELGARELSYKLMFLACSATVSALPCRWGPERQPSPAGFAIISNNMYNTVQGAAVVGLHAFQAHSGCAPVR